MGVGASAGGIKALAELLRSVPADSGMAFVVVQHLAPDHESRLAEILSRHTAMRVTDAEDAALVEPNVVYVGRPGTSLAVEAGTLKESAPTFHHGVKLPIDHLFCSLADAYGGRSVGVVLSGAGSDGTRGLRDVREAGGLAIVQRPESADQSGMPQSSIDAGVADLVLEIAAIPEVLDRFGGVAAVFEEAGGPPRTAASPVLAPGTVEELSRILEEGTDFDIQVYKEATVLRRLLRRMALRGFEDVGDYLEHLRKDEAEQQAMIRDLLIGVTEFFRDPEAFDALDRNVIRPLVSRSRSGDQLRAWVCGCATGEEAYSVAMLFLEAMADARKRLSLQLFATDIDEEALEVARRGVYSSAVSQHVPKRLLNQYFTPFEGRGYQARAPLRDAITFAVHDVCRDPPFSAMQLVTCRNLLIYLKPDAQDRVLELLHFSLVQDGALFLGGAESIRPERQLYFTLSKEWRLFRKLGRSRARAVSNGGRHSFKGPRPAPAGARDPSGSRHSSESPSDRARLSMLRAYVPAGVIVGGSGEIVFMHGELRPYLRLPEGDPRYDLASLIDPELRTRVRAALYKCRRDRETVIAYSSPDVGRSRRTKVTAVPAPDMGEDAIAIFFEEISSEPAAAAAEPGPPEQERLIDQLERELAATRGDLETTVEELEASNAQLRASNEESMSANEELQSSNEELESTSEELRSLNEELTTVNAQLKDKIEQLEQANDDLANFFDSTKIATLFLDQAFRIVKQTPAAQDLLRIGAADKGRFVGDIARDLLQQGLMEAAQSVFETQTPQVAELATGDGRWMVRRVLPYRSESNRSKGIVVTFVDVTDLKAATRRLAIREKQQAVVARLGLSALGEQDIQPFMDRVVREVQQTLDTDLCKILELQPDGDELLLRAGIGWREGLVGTVSVPSGPDSQAGFTLAAEGPVVVEDLPQERRFTGPDLLSEHQVTSGLSVPINGADATYGVLGAHSRGKRRFTREDVNFLQAVAAVVAGAIDRQQGRMRASLESGAIRSLGTADRLETAIRGIHRVFSAAAGASVGELWLPAGDGALSCTLATAEPPHHREDVEAALCGRRFRVGEGLIGGVMQRGRAEWITSFRSEQTFVRLQAAKRLGLESGFAFPILDREHVLGVVSVFSRHRLIATETLLRTLESIGRSIGGFMVRRKTEERSRVLAAIASSSHDAILSCDFEGRVTGWNRAAEQIYGYTAQEMIGASLSRIVPSDRREELERIIQEIERGSAPDPFDTVRLAKGGALRAVSVRASPVFDEAGNVVGVSKVDRDIAEQKRAQEALAESEQRFRATFDNAAVGVAHVSLDGRWLLVNDRLLEITGYSRTELLARTFQQITHPDDLEADLTSLEELLQGRTDSYKTEKRYIRKDRSTVWVDLTVSLVRTPTGDPDYLIGIVADISARKEAEAKVKASEWRFRQVLLSSPLPMLLYDDTGRILAVSRSWTDVTGFDLDEIPSIFDWTRKACRERAEEVDRYVRRLWEIDEAPQTELRIWTKSGAKKTLLVDAALLGEQPEGRRLRIFAAADVTRQRAVEAELREASRQKDEFLAMLGHELRNPLAAMRSAAQLLAVAPDHPGLLEKTRGVLERQTSHMARLLDGLLDVSRIVRGKIQLEEQVVDLGKIVRDVVEDQGDQIRKAGLELCVDLAEGPICVTGDPVRLTQIMDNLLSNAAKYTPVPGRICVSLHDDGGEAVLSVQDTGVGIEPDLMPYIFEVFRQARQGLDRSSGGLGLGLALVKTLVELHRGWVEAKSDGKGKGATFTVRLPITLERPTPSARKSAGRRKILVVEDNEDAAELLKDLLASAGHEVAVAFRGARAIELVREVRPDVIICDLGLPDGMTGFDVAEQLRSDPATAQISLVALTGYGRPEDKARSLRAGFDAHLTKPIDLGTIEDLLSRLPASKDVERAR